MSFLLDWQVHVEEDDVRRIAGQHVIELDPAGCGQDGTAFSLEQRPAKLQNQRIVVEDQNRHFGQRRHWTMISFLRSRISATAVP
jgi:hypothetical protein